MSTYATAPRPASRRQFFWWAGIACGLLIFAGFARSYFLRPLFFQHPLSWLDQLHGLVMTLWFVLFLVQVRLVAKHRIGIHRRLGIAGAVLAVLMLIISVAVVLPVAREGFSLDPANMTAMGFFFFELGVLANFAAFVASALLLRGFPPAHKRLMLLSCLALLGPGISRIPLHFIEVATIWRLIAILDVTTLLFIAVDVLRTRKLHPAFLWGGGWLMISGPVFVWVGNTATWSHVAAWLIR
jgi:hypothetical protein